MFGYESAEKQNNNYNLKYRGTGKRKQTGNDKKKFSNHANPLMRIPNLYYISKSEFPRKEDHLIIIIFSLI